MYPELIKFALAHKYPSRGKDNWYVSLMYNPLSMLTKVGIGVKVKDGDIIWLYYDVNDEEMWSDEPPRIPDHVLAQIMLLIG